MSFLNKISPKRRNSNKNNEGTSADSNISERHTNKRQDAASAKSSVKSSVVKQKMNRMKGKLEKERLLCDEDDELLECERCGRNVDCMIECECCNEWLCIKCGEITSEVLTIINEFPNAVHFYCQKCTDKVKSLIKRNNNNNTSMSFNMEKIEEKIMEITTRSIVKLEERIDEKLVQRLAQVEEQFLSISSVPDEINKNCKTFAETLKSNLSKNPENNADSFKNIVKKAMEEEKKEVKELEDRKRNIILFGAPEKESEIIDERKKADVQLFIDVCNSICTNEILEADILQARRLGKFSSENTTRPLMVTVRSELVKKRIFSQLHKLRSVEQFKNIHVNHDMTKEEKANTKLLVEEAKRKSKELADSSQLDLISKNWVYKVRGPPWDQKIVKLRPRLQ